MSNIIHSRAPLRVSFIGGGTDLPDYYLYNSFGSVISTAINKYVYVSVKNHPDIYDERIRISYSLTELVNEVKDIKNNIIRSAFQFLNITERIHVLIYSDVPASTGLGSSSAFAVALLMALHRFRGDHFTNAQVAEEACHIEMSLLYSKVGKQDQYASAFGGINYFKFRDDNSVSLEPINSCIDSFTSLISKSKLYFTGHTRDASKVLKIQSSEISTKIDYYKKLKQITERCLIKINNGSFDESYLNKVILEGWNLKQKLSDNVMNSDIEKLSNFALDSGANSIKLLGAGGGGFLLVVGSKQTHNKINKKFLSKNINFKISPYGASVYSEL